MSTPPPPPTTPTPPTPPTVDMAEYVRLMHEAMDARASMLDIEKEILKNMREAERVAIEYRKGLEGITELERAVAGETDSAKREELEKSLERIKKKVLEIKSEAADNALDRLFPKSISSGGKEFKSFLGDTSKGLKALGDQMEMFGGDGPIGQMGLKIGNLGTKVSEFAANLNVGTLALIGIGIMAAKFAYQLDNLAKKIGSATGFGNQFNEVIFDGHNATMEAGVSMEEYANSITNLASSYSAFDPSNKQMIKSLANTSTKLEKLGVSAQTSSKMMDHFTRAQGMTAQQAADTTAQIALMGKAIGVTASKMAQDFESASGRLAIYGDKNIKVFKQLEAQAKATGMEVSTLLSISQKFDTFDSAAGSIGQLNAVLGTNLSTLEMMNATDAERVQMMKDQINMSVQSFDSLDKFTKMYIAEAMGVKDVAEAQRLLNMTNAEAAKYQKAQQEQADIQKELADRTAELVPLMDKLKIAGMKLFMALEPLIKGFSLIIEGISLLIDGIMWLFSPLQEMNALGIILTATVIGFGLAWMAATWPVTATVAAVLAAVAAFGALYDAFHWTGSPELWEMAEHVGGNFDSMSDSLVDSQKEMSQFSDKGLGSLYDAFHWTGSSELYKLPKEFADNIVAIADAITETINAVTGFADTLIKMASIDYKGFVAIRTDGGSTSMIMGSEDVVTSLNKGKLTVDVKMPEIKLPEVQVKVYIGNRELKDIIKTEVSSIIGKGG